MLLLNDKKETIKNTIKYDENGNLIDDGKKLIREYSKGYILAMNYLRGEIQILFLIE